MGVKQPHFLNNYSVHPCLDEGILVGLLLLSKTNIISNYVLKQSFSKSVKYYSNCLQNRKAKLYLVSGRQVRNLKG